MAKDFMVKESELDDIQMRVLNSVLDKNIVVSGCAGSGKSVLALQKAKRVQSENAGSCEIVVFTRALCNYMESGRNQLGFNCPFYVKESWNKRYGKPTADYVIVDEIQDFDAAEIQDFMAAARKHFFFFGDTAQSIYGWQKNTCTVKQVEFMAYQKGSCKDFSLYNNYRLPKPVARITQDYIGLGVDPYGDGDVYKSQENVKPKFLKYDSIEKQLEAIVRIIYNKNLTDVGILIPDNDKILEVLGILKQCDTAIRLSNPLFLLQKGNNPMNFEIKYNDKLDWHNNRETLNFNTNNPKLMTYHSAKGLQFETVFLPDFHDPGDPNWQKAIYVAMTRTCRNLYVMYSGAMPAILQCIPTNLYETTETDEIEDF